MIAKALHYKERGYKAIKMQVAHTADLATDLDNVKRMREALGPGIDIMIDVNMGLDRRHRHRDGPQSFRTMTCTGWKSRWCRTISPAAICSIAAALDLRIVGGETHFTRFDLKPFFEKPRACRSCSPIRCAAG